jgi:hypothetical protein
MVCLNNFAYLFFLPLAVFSGAAVFLGLPTGATSRIFSKSSGVYKASCENGLHPARCKRLLIVSCGNLSLSAISEIVIPFMFFIIGILTSSLDIVHICEHLLNRCLVKTKKILKIVHINEYYYLTYCSCI